MRIGLDISFLDRPPSGIGAYLEALYPRLSVFDPAIEIVPITQPRTGIWDHLSDRASRFGWESLAAGLYGRRAGIDLLHMPMMARPPLAGVPVVVTVHDVIPYVMPEYRSTRAMQISLKVARESLRGAAAVIAPSQHAKADISRVLNVPAVKIHVTPEAADARFQPASESERADWSVPERYGVPGRYIFNVGGLDVRKNIPTLIRAFHAIRGDLAIDTWLVIAGAEHATNPVVYPPVKPLVAELGLDDRVIFTGRIQEEDKVALLQRAALYATPTLYEGFGLPILEAMACGTPVVASDRTSIPEIVGEAGVLVPPRVPDLAAGMSSVLNSPDLSKRLTAAGLDRAREFNWDKTAEQTIAVYRSVLKKGAKA